MTGITEGTVPSTETVRILREAAEAFAPYEPAENPAACSRRDRALDEARKTLLVAGLPDASLPVESFFRSFGDKGSGLPNVRGMYGSASAQHLEYLYSLAGIERVPSEFSAMPDHLSLISEFVALLVEAGEFDAARQVAGDHLWWLGEYEAQLASVRDRALGDDADVSVGPTAESDGEDASGAGMPPGDEEFSRGLLKEGIDVMIGHLRAVSHVLDLMQRL